MKKIFINYVVFLSFLLSGCITDSKIVEKSNNFVLSFNKNIDSANKCKTHIVVKKDDRIVVDEREMQCIDKLDIEYNPKNPDDSLLYSKFSFVKETSENGKTYAKYHITTKKISVASTFESEDSGTSIQIPEIVTKDIIKNLFVELGKSIIVKDSSLVFEITYSK